MGRSDGRSRLCALPLVILSTFLTTPATAAAANPSFFWDSHIGVCQRPWEKVYAHDHTGTAVFGHRQALAVAVTSGDVIRIIIDSIPAFEGSQTKTTYVLQADNAIISRNQVCVEAISLYNHFNDHFNDHAQGDTLWNLLLCSATGKLHVLGVKLGSQRVISHRHISASATWYVKSWSVRESRLCSDSGEGLSSPMYCEKKPSSSFWPVYSHFVTGVAVGRSRISTLLEAIKHGQDVRASMRDRGYAFPMHALHWSEEGAWVGGHGIRHVGQRLFPSHVSMRSDRPYLWISSWSTTGRRHNSRWELQGHVSQGANQDVVSLDWMTDACWRHVYTNDAKGQLVRGSLEELLASVRSGHRVRVVVGGMASEADVIRVRGGHVAAQLLSQLMPLSSSIYHHHLLHDEPRWNWKVVHTTGTVQQHEVLLSNHTVVSQRTTSSTVSWFVDTRPWTSLLRQANQQVLSGHVTNVADAVRGGANVRIRLRHTPENGDTFVPAASLKVMLAPNTGTQVTSAQILRFLGDEDVGLSEVRLQEQLIWWMTVVDTQGVMSLSAWDTAHKTKYFDITLTPEIDWFGNE